MIIVNVKRDPDGGSVEIKVGNVVVAAIDGDVERVFQQLRVGDGRELLTTWVSGDMFFQERQCSTSERAFPHPCHPAHIKEGRFVMSLGPVKLIPELGNRRLLSKKWGF